SDSGDGDEDDSEEAEAGRPNRLGTATSGGTKTSERRVGGTGEPKVSAVPVLEAVRVTFRWEGRETCAVDFGRSLLSHVGPHCSEVLLAETDAEEVLDSRECASRLRSGRRFSVILPLAFEQSAVEAKLRLRIAPDGSAEVGLAVSHPDELAKV